MGWKILLPQEIMSEGRKLLEDAGHTVIDGRGFETEDVLADFKEYRSYHTDHTRSDRVESELKSNRSSRCRFRRS